MTIAAFIDRISELAAAGVLASFGGAAQALYQLYKGEKQFSVISFSICVILSFFVGQVVGSFIPDTMQQYHDGLLLMSGFCVFPLLDIFNAYITKLVKVLLNKAYNVEEDTQPQEESK